jgi:hypothetical protein
MGYLDNTSITVDAILTKKGRELLARNDGTFRITQFALGDDEIDYTLFNENHPNGTQYAAEAIENMPLIEAIPDESNMMKSQLITLSRGRSLLPFLTVPGYSDTSAIELTKGGASVTIEPKTSNFSENSTTSQVETLGYKFTVINYNFLDGFMSDRATSMETAVTLDTYGDSDMAEIVMGNTVTITPTNEDALFPTSTTTLTTTLLIEGMNTGAKTTRQITITKT